MSTNIDEQDRHPAAPSERVTSVEPDPVLTDLLVTNVISSSATYSSPNVDEVYSEPPTLSILQKTDKSDAHVPSVVQE